jgi:tRNA uridine 5-carbamoylmethylation protein Kti12
MDKVKTTEERELEHKLRDEIIKFMNSESDYTKNHSLFIANEMLSIMCKFGLLKSGI